MSVDPLCQLVRRELDWDLAPVDVLRLLRSDAHPVALLGAWAGGSDIITSEPTEVSSPPRPVRDVLGGESIGGQIRRESAGLLSSGFGGGWIGYLGFGLGEDVLPAPSAPGSPRRLPGWWFGFYDHVLRRDRSTGRWVFEALWTPARSDALERRFQDLCRRAQTVDTEPQSYACDDFRLSPSADDHRAAVRQTIDYIRRGDIFQANICLRLEAGFSGDPLDAFCRAASSLQPPYAAFLRIPGGAVASLSPELFLRRTGAMVTTKPIKGTRRRPAEPVEAAAEREMLLHSDKDRAENVMIVDLMRNDLNRVCVPGSVMVPRLLHSEAHPGIWHLVSDVEGTLEQGTGDGELIAATFPPGSVTGAPKVRAVEIIHEVEPTPREVYTGAIGYRSPVAGLEFNVAIRTFEFCDGRVWLGSGGGITIGSDAEQEYRECLLKAGPLIGALGARIEMGHAEPVGRSVRSDRGVPELLRPRPAVGVFTSLPVSDGRVDDLHAHLARLEASSWQLYRKHLPRQLAAQIEQALGTSSSGRLRISVQQVGGPLRIRAEVMTVNRRPATVDLVPARVHHGFGAHKWQDSRLVTSLSAALVPGEQLLVLDVDGDVLESERANVFAVVDGVLWTPPVDGRILSGTTRASVLAHARRTGIPVLETSFEIGQLAGATEVFLTDAIDGITPVRVIRGHPFRWRAGPMAARLSALRAGISPALSRIATAPTVAASADHTGMKGSRRRDRPMVVLIDNYDSFTYNLAHLLKNACQVEVVRNDEVSAAAVAAFAPDGIVISPGPCTPADAGISIDVVRACGAATPTLGVCLGHQAIAVAYGGRVISAPLPVHGRASSITHDAGGVLHGVPQQFMAARYHSLLIDEAALPADLKVTARSAGGLPMGLRHVRHPVEGVQFHPESILTEHGASMIGNFVLTMQSRRDQLARVSGS